MQYCVAHPEEINKLAKVKAQVSEVKGVMMENIEKVQNNCWVFLPISVNVFLEVKSTWYPILACMLAVNL